MFHPSRMLARAGLIALIAAVGLPCSAMAQSQPNERPRQRDRGEEGGRRFGGGGGMFGGRGAFEASVTSRSLEGYSKLLGLSADQQTAAKALLEGYQQSFETLTTDAREKMSEMREQMRGEMGDGPNPDMFRRMGEEMEKFRKARAELDKGFMDDLKSVLTPEQEAKWPALERLSRREQTIGRGLMSGERVDLIRIVDGLELDDKARTDLAPVLEQYSIELDRELAARNTVYDTAQTKMREIFQAGPDGDFSAMDKLFADGREASTRVRDVNRRFARQVDGMLPETVRSEFDQQVRRESFPLIYRQSYEARAVKAASELADLDESQKSTIQTITEAFNRDLAAVNRDLEAAASKREESLKPQDLMPGGQRFGGGGRGGPFAAFMDDPEISKLIERRNALQEAALEKLRTVLKPEQFEALPKRGEGRRGEDEDRAGREDRGDDTPRRRPGGNREGGGGGGGRPSAPPPGPTR